ncbi:MAG TPA: ribose-phosphate pyrophosphokinase [Casimicrobiaceae bacterium]|nr:ribose-phosphate pyrophosphokinase [Casimicrobiaceae bacterium]
MTPVIFAFPSHTGLPQSIVACTGGTAGTLFLHRFPDGESYVRLDTPVAGREVAFVCSLDNPDAKLLQLLFAVAAAKDLGAKRVGIVAPYLAYMRQDTRFKPGEAVTSATVGRLISGVADWLVTVDPHLHRHASLDAVYSIPSAVVRSAPAISAWVAANVARPLLVGPDGESAQWVGHVAAAANAPWIVLEKSRHGDRDVEVSAPRIEDYRDRTPVVIDDIVSTAHTMIAAVGRLREAGLAGPICVAVHALFATGAYGELEAAGAARIVTCNTIPHASNGIDVNAAIAGAVAGMVGA